MGNPVLDDADDEVELSFYEWIESSPYNGIIIGVTLSSLIFTVFLSVFLRCQCPNEVQGYRRTERRCPVPQSTTYKGTETANLPQAASRDSPPANVQRATNNVPEKQAKTMTKRTAPHASKPQIVLSPSRSMTRPRQRPPDSLPVLEHRQTKAVKSKQKNATCYLNSEEHFLLNEGTHDQHDLSDNSSPPFQLGRFYGAPVHLDRFSAAIDQLGDSYSAPVRLAELSSALEQLDKFSSSSMTSVASSPTVVPSPTCVCRSFNLGRIKMPHQRLQDSTASVGKSDDGPDEGCVWKIILPKDDSFRVNITCTKLGDAGVSCELPKSVETFISSLLVNESLPGDARACVPTKSRQEPSDTGNGERLTNTDSAITCLPPIGDIEPAQIKQLRLNTFMLKESLARNMSNIPKECSSFRHTRQRVGESRNIGANVARAEHDAPLLPTGTAPVISRQRQASAARRNILLSGQSSEPGGTSEVWGGVRRKIETIRMSSSSSWSSVEEDLDLFRTCNETTNPLRSDEELKSAAHDDRQCSHTSKLPYGRHDDDLVLMSSRPKNATRPGKGIKLSRLPSKPTCLANKPVPLQGSANLLPGVRACASKDDISKKRKCPTGSSTGKDERHVLGKTSNAIQSSASGDDSEMSVLLYPNSNKKQSDEHLRITYRPRSAAKLTTQPVPTFMLSNTGNQSQCCHRRRCTTNKMFTEGSSSRRVLPSKRDVNGNKLTPTNIFDCTAELREIIQITMKDLERYNPTVSPIPSKKLRKDCDKGRKVSYENNDSLVVRRGCYKAGKRQIASASGECRIEPQSAYKRLLPSISPWTNQDKDDILADSASTSTKRKSQSMPRRSSRVDRKQYDSRLRVKFRKSLKTMLGIGRNVSITSINSYSASMTLSRHSGEPGETSSNPTSDNLKRSVYKSPCFYFMDHNEDRSIPMDNLLSNEHYVCLKGEYPRCLKASFTTKSRGAVDRSFDRSANYHEDDPLSQCWVVSDSDQPMELPSKTAVALVSLSESDTNKLSLSSLEDQNVRSENMSCLFHDGHQKSYKMFPRKFDVPNDSQTRLNSRKRLNFKKSTGTKKYDSELDDHITNTSSFVIEPLSGGSTELSSYAQLSDPYDMSVAFRFGKYIERPRFASKSMASRLRLGNRKVMSASSSRETVSATTITLLSHERAKATNVKVSNAEFVPRLYWGGDRSASDLCQLDRNKDTDLCSNYNYQEIDCRRGNDVMETTPSLQISISSPFDMSQVCARVEIDSSSVQVSGVNMKRVNSKLPIIIKSRNVETFDEDTRGSNKLAATTYSHRNGPNKKVAAKDQQSKARLMVSKSKGQYKTRYLGRQEIVGKCPYDDKIRQRENIQLMEKYLYKGLSVPVIDSIAEVSEASPCDSCSQQFRSSGLETNRNEKSAHESSENSASDSTAERETLPSNPHNVSARDSTEAVVGSEVGGKRLQKHYDRAKTARGHTKQDVLDLIRRRKMTIADRRWSKQKSQDVASELGFPESCARRAPPEIEKGRSDKKERNSVMERGAVVVTSSSHTYLTTKCENFKVYQRGCLKEVNQSASDESGQGSVDVCVVERSQSTREIVVEKNCIQNRSTGKKLWGFQDHVGDKACARTSVDFDSEQISYMEIVPKQGKWRGLQLSEISDPNVGGKLKESANYNNDQKKEAKESSTSTSSSEVICKLLILPSGSASAQSFSCLDIHISSPRSTQRVEPVGNPPKKETRANKVPSSKTLPEHVNTSLISGRTDAKNIACVSNDSRAEANQSEREEAHQIKELDYGEPVNRQHRNNLGNTIKSARRENVKSQEKHECSHITDVGVSQRLQSKHDTVQQVERPLARATKRYINKSVREIASKNNTSLQSEIPKPNTLQQAVETSYSKAMQKEVKDTLVVLPEFLDQKIDHVCQTEINEPPIKVDKHIQCPTLGSQAAIELMDLLSLIQTGKQYFTQTMDKKKSSDPNARVVVPGVRPDNCSVGRKKSPKRLNSKILKPFSESSEDIIQMTKFGEEFNNYRADLGHFSKGQNSKQSSPGGQKNPFGHWSSQRNTHLNEEISSREDRPAYSKTLGDDKPEAIQRCGGQKDETPGQDFSKIHRTQQCLRSHSKNVQSHKVSHDRKNQIFNKKVSYETLTREVRSHDSTKDVKRKNCPAQKLAHEKQLGKPTSNEVNKNVIYRNHVHYEEGENVKNNLQTSSPVVTKSARQGKPLQDTELNKSIFCKHLTKTHVANYIAKLAPDTKISENDLKTERRGLKAFEIHDVLKPTSKAREGKEKIGKQTQRASSQLRSKVGSDRLDQLLVLDSGKCSAELNNTKSEDVNLYDFIEINRGHHLFTPRAPENSGSVLEEAETLTNSRLKTNFLEMGNENSGPGNGPPDYFKSITLNRETNAKKSFQKSTDKTDLACTNSDVKKGFTVINDPSYLLEPQVESKVVSCTKDESNVVCQDQNSKIAAAKITSKGEKEIKIQINLNMMESRASKDRGTPDTMSQDSMALTPHRLKRLGRVGRLPVYQKRLLRRYERQVDKTLTSRESRTITKANSDHVKQIEQSPTEAAPTQQPETGTAPESAQPKKRKQLASSNGKQTNAPDVKDKKVMTSQTELTHVASQRKKADIYNTLLSALLLALKAPEDDWQRSKAGHSHHYGNTHGTALISGHRDESDQNIRAAPGEKCIHSDNPMQSEKPVCNGRSAQNEKHLHNETPVPCDKYTPNERIVHSDHCVQNERPVTSNKKDHIKKPIRNEQYVQTIEIDSGSTFRKSMLPRVHSDPSQQKSQRHDNSNSKRHSTMVLSSLEPETLNSILKGCTAKAGPPSSTHSPRKSKIPVMKPELRASVLRRNCFPAVNRGSMRETPLSTKKIASNVSLSVPPRAESKRNASVLNSTVGKSDRRSLSRQVPGESRSSREKWPIHKHVSSSEPTPPPRRKRVTNINKVQRDVNSSKLEQSLREYKHHANTQKGSRRRSNGTENSARPDSNASRGNHRGKPALLEKEFGAFRDQLRVRHENATKDDVEIEGEKHATLNRYTLSSYNHFPKKDQAEWKTNPQRSQRAQKMPPVNSDEHRFGKKGKMRYDVKRLKSRHLELESLARQKTAPKDFLNVNGCRTLYIGLEESSKMRSTEVKENFQRRDRRSTTDASDNMMKPFSKSGGPRMVSNKFSQKKFYFASNAGLNEGVSSSDRHFPAQEKSSRRGKFCKPAQMKAGIEERLPSTRKKGHAEDNVLFSTASSPPTKPQFSPPGANLSSSNHHFDTSDDVSATNAFDHAGSLANQSDRTRAPRTKTRGHPRNRRWREED